MLFRSVVCQSKRFNYDRWYKIRLNKTQRIRVYFEFDDRSSDILLYDFKGNEIPTRYVMVYNNEGRQENCYARSKKQLPKGTYFLVIKHSRSRYDFFTTRFWWK